MSGGRGFNFVFAVEDQRDWQRIKGCFRNSFSCFFCHMLRVLNVRKVLDVNYGIGSFYEKCFQDLEITGVDVKRWNWIVEPDHFILSDMNVEFNALLNAIEIARRRGLADYIILKYMPIANEEVELLRIAKYRAMWRFVRHTIAAHNGNKVVRNYTEIFIIEGNI